VTPLRKRIGRARALELAGAVAFALFASWPFLDPGGIVAGFDTVAFTVPNQDFAFAALRDLRLPGWNDLVFDGVPGFANPQLGALYPLKWPFLWMDTHNAVELLTVVHLVLLAIGAVVLFGGCLRLRPPAALLGAVALTGCGYAIARTLHFEQLVALSYGPWLLAVVDAAVAGTVRPRRAVVLVALPLALAALGGHQQPLYLLVCIAVLYAIGRALDLRRARGLLVAASGALLGGGLAAIQLVPSALLAGRSVRSGGVPIETLDDLAAFVLQPRRLPQVLLGDTFAARSDIASGGLEAMSFVGAVVFGLALVGLATGLLDARRRFLVLGLLLVAIASAALAVGPRSPLFRAAYDVLPGFDLFRVPVRALFAFDVAASMLAAFGVDAIASRRVGSRALLAAGGAAAVGLVPLAAGALERPRAVTLAFWLVAGVLVAGTAMLHGRAASLALTAVVAAAAIELGVLGWHGPLRGTLVDEPVDPVSPAARFLGEQPERSLSLGRELLEDPLYLAQSLRANLNGPLGVRSLDGYDGGPAVSRRWVDAMTSVAADPFNADLTMRAQVRQPLSPELFALFGVRYVLVDVSQWDPSLWLSDWQGPIGAGGALQVFENPAYAGEAFLYGATRFLAGKSGPALAALGDELHSVVLVEENGPRLGCDGCARVPVTLERPGSGRLAAATKSARPSLLVVAEQWDPGWRAEVDAEAANPVPVDGLLLGVPVPPGSHRVSLVYEIDGLGLGIPLTLAALSLAFVLLLPLRGTRRSSSL
jgi:hypothetical protein